MKQLLMLLFAGVSIIFFSCQEESTFIPELSQNETASVTLAKPLPNLIGTMDLYFDVTAVWPEEPVWLGTVTFSGYGDFDGTFDLRFYHFSEFKNYSQASPFEERFEIYQVVNGDTVILLAGPDFGVTTLANNPPDSCKYVMNGSVEVANEQFTPWLGRNVHMSGKISWQFLTLPDGTVIGPVPEKAPGIMRIN